MITEHGGGIMLDISPEMWICGDCGEVFRVELFEDPEQSRKCGMNRSAKNGIPF